MNSEKEVLIVEDSEDMQDLLKILLEAKGYKTRIASNGEAALDSLHSSEKLPDLILLDSRMPVMDGFDFITRKRKLRRIKNIPVVVMSGEDDCDLVRSQSNSPNVLRKPLNMSSLLEAVGRNTIQ